MIIRTESDTNSSLAAARRCPHKYELGYAQRLTLEGENSEALQVGDAWHKAHHWAHRKASQSAAYDALRRFAPSPLWNEKLSRLFAAHGSLVEPLQLELVEHTFEVELEGYKLRGQIDGLFRLPDGRVFVLERKTTSDDIALTSPYWSRLRLDVQTGLYYLAARAEGFSPSGILYEVTRKPTIRPARPGVKKDRERWLRELEHGAESISYYGEAIPAGEARDAIANEKESQRMYGARLSADIGNNPAKYFAREPVERTEQDFEDLTRDLLGQLDLIEHMHERGFFPRNPDGCHSLGTCEFFSLCQNGIYPGADQVPSGFRRREHLHPELVDDFTS